MYPLVPKQFHNVPTIIRTLSSSHQGSYSANDELLGKHTSFHRATEAFIHQPCPWSSRHQWGKHCMSTEKTDACCCLHVTTCPLIEMTDLSNFTPGYISKKALFQKDTCIPMFIAALFTITKIGNWPKIYRKWYIYIYTHRHELVGHCTSEISRIEKGKYCIISLHV